jgi:gamma-butyrobetaine dioxygenase
MSRKIFIRHIDADKRKFVIHWSDEIQSSCSYLFLRDNCDSLQCLHPNGQKLIDTIEIPDDIGPSSWKLNEDRTLLKICWNNDHHHSEYTWQWLRDNTVRGTGMERDESHFLWDYTMNSRLPEKDFYSVEKSENDLMDWLSSIRKFGFGILHQVPVKTNFVLDFIRLFGFVRETNYGKVFDVRAEINPNNMAYTTAGISPHTDNPYRHPIPTLQVLHCLQSSTSGGDSILVDGFTIAKEIRKYYPSQFQQLTRIPLTYRFRDKSSWLENSAPVITRDLHREIKAIAYNNRSVCTFRLDEEEMDDYYEAYRTFGRMVADPKFQTRFKMEPGDLYIVNNERILHGRTAYENNQGERWLQGAYADIDALLSKLRILNAGK